MKPQTIVCLALIAGLHMVPSVSRAETLLERIATSVLADKFGIDTRAVNIFQQQTREPIYDLAPYYEGSHHFNRDPRTIWKLRESGMGWGQIAQKVGMQPGAFNKLRNSGAFDRDRFWTDSYSDRFDIPQERVATMRRSGGTLEDVLGAIVVGKLSKQDPRTVYDQYKTQRSWTSVASTNRVNLTDWRRVSAPVRSRYKLASSDSTAGGKSRSSASNSNKGKSTDKGNSKGKATGKSSGKGSGKSTGKGKSEGKGKGKGS